MQAMRFLKNDMEYLYLDISRIADLTDFIHSLLFYLFVIS